MRAALPDFRETKFNKQRNDFGGFEDKRIAHN